MQRNLRLSAQEDVLVERARGGVPRNTWLRRVVVAAATAALETEALSASTPREARRATPRVTALLHRPGDVAALVGADPGVVVGATVEGEFDG